jgi:DNA repair protein RecO (recombination protein O)
VTLLESEALVVRAVEVGESDVVATFVTERAGKLAAVARGARKGSRRLGGALEPMHTVAILVDDRGGDLATLKEGRIVRVRPALAANLEALDAAGVALRWARHLFPPRTPEPEGWRVLVDLLDALDGSTGPGPLAPVQALAHAGLSMLAAVGYALDLDRCVVCGRSCPEGRPACVDPARGGLVCRACGGAATLFSSEIRQAAHALERGNVAAVDAESARIVLGVVDRAMAAHAGFER